MGHDCERQSIFKYAPVTYKESTVVSKDYSTPLVEESGLKYRSFFECQGDLNMFCVQSPYLQFLIA